MNSEQCKNCPLIKEIELLKEEIKILKEKLEKYEKPEKNSGNSSLPPSSDKNKKYYPKRDKSGKKPGGQSGHKGHSKMLMDKPDAIIELYPEKCSICGNDHFIKKEQILERRQVIDIPEIKPYIKEYQQKVGICSKCNARNIGNFPKNISPNIQIGQRAKGLIGYLNVAHNISYDRLSQIFEDILGLKISKGSIDNKLNELAEDLNPEYQNILEKIKSSDIIGSDETVVRINGENKYTWVFQNNEYTIFKTAPRSFETIEETIGKSFKGSWVSDRLSTQLKIEALHQLCLPHLIRQCKFIIESENSEWAKDLKDFFTRSMEFRRNMGNNFNPLDTENFKEILRFKKELEEIFSKPPPNEEERKLFKGLFGRQQQLIHFLENPKVPYDNNGSERALRNRVIHQKVAGCFRSDNGANVHDIIASVIETAKKYNMPIKSDSKN
jgi:transposase